MDIYLQYDIMKASGVLYEIVKMIMWTRCGHRSGCEHPVQCAGSAAMNQDIEIEIFLMLVIYAKVPGRPSLAHVPMVEFDKVELI